MKTPHLSRLLAAECRNVRPQLRNAALCAAALAFATVALLGLSGWFLAGAALAGLAGPLVALAFNYMLPSAGIRLLAIVRTGARYGERVASHAAALSAMAGVRTALFRSLSRRSLALGTGDATARLVNDVEAIEREIARASAPWSLVGVLGGIALAGALAGLWTALAITGSCAAVLVLGTLLGRVEARRLPILQQRQGELRELVTALSNAAAELRCYGVEASALAEIDRVGRLVAAEQERQAGLRARIGVVTALGAGAAGALTLFVAASHGAAFAAFAALIAVAAVDAIAPMLAAAVERTSLDEARLRLERMIEQGEEDSANGEPIAGPLRIASPIAAQLSPGARFVLATPSGSGKSTLFESLIGLRTAEQGQFAIGDRDATCFTPASLRATFAWSPQDAMLIGGTVRDNLRLAAPDADDSVLWQALTDAALDDRVRALPGGLDYWIGDGGITLSGGERKRLSLARAYCAATPWLLLDEPTAGLDPVIARRVVTMLANRLDRTGQGILVATHAPGLFAEALGRSGHATTSPALSDEI